MKRLVRLSQGHTFFATLTILATIATGAAIADPPSELTPPDPGLIQVLPGAERPGSDPLQLLQVEQVQEELALTEEQIQLLEVIDDNARSQLGQRTRGTNPLVEMDKQVQETRQLVAEVLEVEQLNRFREILLQVNGWAPEGPPPRTRGGVNIEDPINLSAAQEDQLSDLQNQAGLQVRGNFVRTRSSDPSAICETINANRERIEPIRQASQQEAVAILTEEQQATLATLEGETFALEAPDCQY